MRISGKSLILSAALLGALCVNAQAQNPPSRPAPAATGRTVQNFIPITDEMMRAPKPENWMMMRGNYQGWGYSTLDQINKSNVKGLQLVWARVMEPGINEATPLV